MEIFSILYSASFVVTVTCAAAFFLQRAKLKTLEREAETLRGENKTLRRELESSERTIVTLKLAVKARAETLGNDSTTALSISLDGLREAVSDQVEVLTASTKLLPYRTIQKEMDSTRLRDRKMRFENYLSSLRAADVKIGNVIELLRDDLTIIAEILDRLKSGRLDPAAGVIELEAISKVLNALNDEAARQIYEDLALRSRKAEFENILKFKEAMFSAQERLRRRQPPNPKVLRATVDPKDVE
jgi:hypothetical protein